MQDFNFDDFSDFGDFGSDAEPEAAAPDTAAPATFTGGPALPNGAALAVVDSDEAVRDYLSGLLGEGVATLTNLAELESRLGMTPIVAVLGPSCASSADLTRIEAWSRTRPEVGTLLVTAELSTDLLRTAMRAGVKDVLTAPIDQMNLVETVSRIAEGLRVAAPSGVPSALQPGGGLGGDFDGEEMNGRVITVFSTKGGSGKSVVATNLAVSLARQSDKPVILIDGHLQFGDVAVMLKLQPQNTVVDAVSQIDKLDTVLMQQLLTSHEPSGLLVLPAPLEPTFADQITGQQMAQVIDLCRQLAGHIVIDTPAIFNEVVLSTIEASDDVLLVAGLDIPNIKNVKVGLSTLSLLDVPREKLHLILNRADSKVKLDVGEVEKTLQIQAAAHVPSDVVVPISVNKGSPVVLSAPRSGVAKALEELAFRLLESQDVAMSGSSKRKFF